MGSRDSGLNGPVRYLQNTLIAWDTRMAAAVGLIPDGDYGERTARMVVVLQASAISDDMIVPDGFTVDGDCGPNTREYIKDFWRLDLNAIPFIAGGECEYCDSESPEPQLWNPLAPTSAAADSLGG
jgi:hypothetical protein